MRRRKKQEFRKDKPHTGFFGKLYITKKQRKSLLRWALYALLLLVLCVVQDTMLTKVRILGASTDLVPCGIFLIAVLLTDETSLVFAMVSSLIYLLSGSAPGPYSMVLITFLAFGAAIFRQSYLRKGFSAAMLCVGAALLLYEIIVFLIGFVSGLTPLSRITGFIATTLMTFAFAPVLYPLVQAIGKIGGDSWKE